MLHAKNRYSKVAWARNERLKRVRVINDWPNPAATLSASGQVPSVISYEDGKLKAWGYEVNDADDCIRWLRILLETYVDYANPLGAVVAQSQETLKTLGKPPDQ